MRVEIKKFRTKPLRGEPGSKLDLSQGKVSGFALGTYQKTKVAMVGAGGIGSNVALGLVRKGIGVLAILDDDDVEPQNLTRQLFYPRDIGKNKAIRLAKRLSREGFFQSEILAYPLRFQEMVEREIGFKGYDVLICGVDNNPSRLAVSSFAIYANIPVIHAAVSRDGNQLYCAVQEPGEACFGCTFPHFLNDDSYPCNLPGIIDVLQVVSGLVVYALDTLLCGRYREWNLKSISLDGSLPDTSKLIARRQDCRLCGN